MPAPPRENLERELAHDDHDYKCCILHGLRLFLRCACDGCLLYNRLIGWISGTWVVFHRSEEVVHMCAAGWTGCAGWICTGEEMDDMAWRADTVWGVCIRSTTDMEMGQVLGGLKPFLWLSSWADWSLRCLSWGREWGKWFTYITVRQLFTRVELRYINGGLSTAATYLPTISFLHDKTKPLSPKANFLPVSMDVRTRYWARDGSKSLTCH